MNVLQNRLAATSFMLRSQRGGACGHSIGYAIGEQLRSLQDVDLQIESGVVSVPKGTVATVKENNSQQLLLDLGEQLGKFVLEMSTVGTYFEKAPKTESAVVDRDRRRVHQHIYENETTATPGAYVEVTGYDANIGPNRGPDSPGLGGYSILVGKRGMIATLFGEIKGVKTYKVQLEQGGEFVLGETEFKVITGVGAQESADGKNRLQECDTHALMALGLGL